MSRSSPAAFPNVGASAGISAGPDYVWKTPFDNIASGKAGVCESALKVSFPQVFPLKLYKPSWILPYMLHVPLLSISRFKIPNYVRRRIQCIQLNTVQLSPLSRNFASLVPDTFQSTSFSNTLKSAFTHTGLAGAGAGFNVIKWSLSHVVRSGRNASAGSVIRKCSRRGSRHAGGRNDRRLVGYNVS